jgi:hypothetical protein
MHIKEELHGKELGVVAVLGVGLADLAVSWKSSASLVALMTRR